jgi:uncharacterized protein (DUF1501 family)
MSVIRRRDLMKLSAAGLLSGASVLWLETLAAKAASQPKKSKACILLWMDGGPSQAHTFDPKPGGEFKSISTSVPGIQVCDGLPQLAKVMDDIALVRGMSTGEGGHYRAKYLLHTGYQRVGGFEHPALGCVASHELGDQSSELPAFMTIDAGFDKGNGGRLYRNVPAYLGVQHSPLAVRDPSKGLENLPADARDAELASRLELLGRSERRFASQLPDPLVSAKQAAFNRAVSLMQSKRANAFELDEEPGKLREAYGDHKFGKACLMARRLVEAGASFVEIFHRGWDDHEGAAKRIVERSKWMDPAMATLITDLKDRGLLDDTLIVWMGEFGRSPVDGKGHYARAWTTALAGGGLKTGQAIGKTDEKGKKPGGTVVERPVSTADFFATICRALGIDHTKEFHAAGERPIPIVEKGAQPISELFG